MARSQRPTLRWLIPLVGLLTCGWVAVTVARPAPALAQAPAVTIQDFSFSPATLQIAAGTTVTWTNQGPSPHTVTADNGAFDSGPLNPGQSFSFTFTTAGTFAYHCSIHPRMTATIVVTAASAATTPERAVPGTSVTPPATTAPAASATTTTPAPPPGGNATTSRPAHIHAGDCVNLGDVVQPLTNLTAATGRAEGQRNRAIPAESSFTTVPMTLDQILASDHAVNVHLSADQIGTYIACGEIGGVVDANGALTIGLRELNHSGYTGIAYLAPTADGTGTDVSVFIAPTQGQGQRTARPAAATPAAATTTLRLAQKSGIGQYLTDANGHALYTYKNDASNTSTCTGQCAATWPPLLSTGALTLPAGVGGTLSTITRPDGSMQVTYNGMPLYHFAKDTDSADTYGQGVGGVWFVAQPQSA